MYSWTLAVFNLFLKAAHLFIETPTPSLKSKHSTPNSREITELIFWCRFSPQGWVWWDFTPFLGAAFTHPYFTPFTHPNALGVHAVSPEPITGHHSLSWKQYHRKCGSQLNLFPVTGPTISTESFFISVWVPWTVTLTTSFS